MYKALLCMRYLRSRYIALASIVSVMLGVATMIVVNSVMSGFTTEMRDRIHGILSDVVVQYNSLDGDDDPIGLMREIQNAIGDEIVAMTPTVDIPGMLIYKHHGQYNTQPVVLVGIDPESKAQVGPFKEYLMSFQESELDGKTIPPERSMEETPSFNLTEKAREYRKKRKEQQARLMQRRASHEFASESSSEITTASAETEKIEKTPVTNADSEEPVFDEEPEFDLEGDDPVEGIAPVNEIFGKMKPEDKEEEKVDPYAPLDIKIIVGAGLSQVPIRNDKTGKIEMLPLVRPGEDANIATPNCSYPPELKSQAVTVVDIFKSGMSEYDSKLVFCNLKGLQLLRGMLLESQIDGEDKKGAITSVQIKLKDYGNAQEVVDKLKAVLPPVYYTVRTWENQQGPLLSAVDIETKILNILLFLIIAVAGFGILAIFFMIVVEKTRDIGILKSLGASSNGVMSIFLSYGLALGVVGSGVGVILGLTIVKNINTIEKWMTWLTGTKVFDERIYYFPEIPTMVSPWMVMWVAAGAIAISVLASILPARRASQLHPVQALRYE